MTTLIRTPYEKAMNENSVAPDAETLAAPAPETANEKPTEIPSENAEPRPVTPEPRCGRFKN